MDWEIERRVEFGLQKLLKCLESLDFSIIWSVILNCAAWYSVIHIYLCCGQIFVLLALPFGWRPHTFWCQYCSATLCTRNFKEDTKLWQSTFLFFQWSLFSAMCLIRSLTAVWPVTVMDGAMKFALASLFTQPPEVSCGGRNFSPFVFNRSTTRYLLLDERCGSQQVDY